MLQTALLLLIFLHFHLQTKSYYPKLMNVHQWYSNRSTIKGIVFKIIFFTQEKQVMCTFKYSKWTHIEFAITCTCILHRRRSKLRIQLCFSFLNNVLLSSTKRKIGVKIHKYFYCGQDDQFIYRQLFFFLNPIIDNLLEYSEKIKMFD